MSTSLYLDTARLGRMCPEAQAADRDFARLGGEEGCSLYFERFLRWGYTALPRSLRRSCPSLAFWAGVPAFKNDLNSAAALPRGRPLLVANRSAQLVRLAARLLCLRCENVLVTDMEWPAYLQILFGECRRRGCLVTVAPLRQSVFRDAISQEELIARLAACYRRQNCDGLLLSAVTCQGLRLPIQGLVEALGDRDKPRLVVVDGAQALNHIPLGLANAWCDLFLAGCHKWLGAYYPLGLLFCCRPAVEDSLAGLCREMLCGGELDDPLLSFTTQLENDAPEPYSETVNLGPMFTAAAAVRRVLGSGRSRPEELSCQMANAERVADRAARSGWRPLRTSIPTRTGILLLEAESGDTRLAPVERLRERFLTSGVAVSAYDGGIVRTSLPKLPLAPQDMNLFHSALCRCA
jgi:hypothetical protein